MSDNLTPLETFAGGLIAALAPGERKKLAKDLARELRERNVKRIAAQTNPDGSPFEPRKPQLRKRKGRLRTAMFAKLRTARFLKAEATADAATVTFTDPAQRIAQVHQGGLRDRVSRRNQIEVRYPARRLLGIAAADEALAKDVITAHLANRL